MIKFECDIQDINLSQALVARILKDIDRSYFVALAAEEIEPLYLQGEFLSAQMEIDRIGHREIIKALAVGSHPYRSDCGKCPRCYRYRPEIKWNNENLKKPYLCNRCSEFMEGKENVTRTNL